MKKLKFLDATLIVAGSMIGSGIFIVSADMARSVGSAGWLIMLWVVSGIMTLLAALSYAELAAMFPKAGGQYVYLKESYNPLIAFLYGWTSFAVIQCGTIAAVAVAFAKFSGVLYPPFSEKNILFTIGNFNISAAQIIGVLCLVFLTYINTKGMQYGKMINLIFNSAKIIALFGLIILGIFVFADSNVWQVNLINMWQAKQFSFNEATHLITVNNLTGISLASAFGAAMVGSLFSSDAWNNITFIAGDVDQPQKNLPKSLLVGTLIVCTLYVLANIAYLKLLPLIGDANASSVFDRGIQFASQDRVGVSAATMMLGSVATIVMAVLIMVSTFGCNNGIILASARIYQTMAIDNLFFSKMKNNNEHGVPAYALWIQCIWAAILCLSGQYGALLDYVMFAVMLFYILTVAGVIILRIKAPQQARPYKTWGYPVMPILYIILALLFCINLLYTKPIYGIGSLLIVLLGIPVYFFWRKK